MARTTGLGTASMELLRPTAADDTEGPVDEGEGRGDVLAESQTAPKRTRKARPAPSGDRRARNIRLSDDVHDRLWQLAHQRRTTVSAVADDLLNKALPRYEVKRQG